MDARVVRSNSHRREKNQRHPVRTRNLPNSFSQHQAVHFRHLHVQNRQIVCLAARQQFERVGAASRFVWFHLPVFCLEGQDPAVCRVVVDDQEAAALEGVRVIGGVLRRRREAVDASRNAEAEDRAGSDGALDMNAAPHHLHQAFADGQSQARPAELAGGGGVALDEGVEQFGDGFSGDSDAGVGDSHAQLLPFRIGRSLLRRRNRRTRHVDDDLAELRKLDRIPEQVDQDLPESSHVTDDFKRDGFIFFVDEFESFFRGFRSQQIQRLLDALADAEGLLIELEFSGLHFGEIEYVVDDIQQGVAAGFDNFALFRVQISLEQEAGHGDDTVHRGPDFVAHICKELRLGACCGLGGIASGLEFTIGLLQFVLQQFGAQGGTYARPQFGNLEGFGDVIDRAELKSLENVVRAVQRG